MLGIAEAERALELADEAFSQFDVDGVVIHLSAAVRGFTAVGDKCRAAMACVQLGGMLGNTLGNLTAGRAWFARATRLVENEPPCLEQGWVAVAAMGCDVDDPERLLAAAELAIDRGRRFGDINLETKALADAGLAHVQLGRVPEGMALLDEAMALACGPADDTSTAAKSVCSFFTACYYAADFERAGSWADLLRTHGLIGTSPGSPAFLSSHCDSVQAMFLIELGRWGEADALLLKAKSDFEAVMPMPSWHPDIVLAELRIRQGRFAEAEALLIDKTQTMHALLPAARLHLERGDYDLARTCAMRGLRLVGDDRLRAVELLTVLVDADLANGDVAAARRASGELEECARAVDVFALRARVAAAQARVLAAAGDLAGAIDTLESALDALDPRQLPWIRTVLLLDLAGVRERSGDLRGATIDARTAASTLDTLDVVLTESQFALLQRLDQSRRAVRTAALTRDGKWWVASCAGMSVRLASTKGLRYVAELVARPGTERHALDLVDSVEGVSPLDGDVDRRALGDAGAMLDGRARTAYRHRIEQLRAEIDEALELGGLETAEARQYELDLLVGQLAQAFGLGGRGRRAGSACERARLNVTRALRAAIAKLAEALPEAGAALHDRVRTGVYCAYEPEGDDEIRWIVQS